MTTALSSPPKREAPRLVPNRSTRGSHIAGFVPTPARERVERVDDLELYWASGRLSRHPLVAGVLVSGVSVSEQQRLRVDDLVPQSVADLTVDQYGHLDRDLGLGEHLALDLDRPLDGESGHVGKLAAEFDLGDGTEVDRRRGTLLTSGLALTSSVATVTARIRFGSNTRPHSTPSGRRSRGLVLVSAH
jgi:hypothetical protein